jgi:hypothetical protein
LGEASDTGYEVSDLSADTAYEFAVSAVSASGCEGQKSAPITVRTQTPDPVIMAAVFIGIYQPDINRGSDFLHVGDGASGFDHRFRSYFKVAGVEGLEFLQLILCRYYEDPYGTDLAVSVHPVTQDWDPSTINWNNKPAHDASVEIRYTARYGRSSDTIDLTSLLAYWRTHANYGFVIKATDERDLSPANHVVWYGLGSARPPGLVFN